MDDFSQSIMIALLPINSDWCQIECPHMTLVYAGEIKDQPSDAFSALAKDASTIAALSKIVTVRTMGVEVFGDEDKVNVIRLQTSPELLAMRRICEAWNQSEFPFRPHVTIGPVSGVIPEVPGFIAFNKVMVGWGNEQLVFNLMY